MKKSLDLGFDAAEKARRRSENGGNESRRSKNQGSERHFCAFGSIFEVFL